MRKTVTEWEQISASWLTDERLTPRISYGTAVKGQPTGNEWRIHRTDVSAEKTLAWPISTCKGCANCAFSIPASRQGQAHDVQRGLTSYPRGRLQSRKWTTARADEWTRMGELAALTHAGQRRVCSRFRKQLSSISTSNRATLWPRDSPPRCISWDTWKHGRTNTCIWMLVVALLIIARKSGRAECLSADKGINKMRPLYTMKHYQL